MFSCCLPVPAADGRGHAQCIASPDVLMVQPLILERVPQETEARSGGPVSWIHTKALYRLTEESKNIIKGCTDEMCSTSVTAPGEMPPWSSQGGPPV